MQIKLGYEIPTGNQVDIDLSHLIVCGVTQLSGKTTTLEALISRSGRKAIVFKTKIGEKSFSSAKEVSSFFKDRSDYEFVRSLIEAYSREKLFIEKGTLMELCKDSRSLNDIKETIDNTLVNSKLRSIEKEIYTRLQHYLGNLIPQIRNAHLSKVLVLSQGINVMNLEKFSEEVQSLIIQSTLDEVLANHKDVVVVIPEAWKFIPQKYNNPCKRSVESYIRQGAASGNYIWIDSQDMAGVDKTVLKQVSTWILGYQAERNEVKHTLDQIPLPSKSKPKEDSIMTLKPGQFYLANNEGMKLVYVQPAWLLDDEAQQIAMGKRGAEYKDRVVMTYSKTNPPRPEAPAHNIVQAATERLVGGNPDQISLFQSRNFFPPLPAPPAFPLRTHSEEISLLKSQMNSLRVEVYNKIESLESIIRCGIAPPVYTVSPLEKIQKDFQAEAKTFILGEIAKLDDTQKKILKFVEVQGKGCSLTLIIDQCLHLSATSGGTRDKIAKILSGATALKVIRKDKNNIFYPNLKDFIQSYSAPHGITDQEVQQVYDHILAETIS